MGYKITNYKHEKENWERKEMEVTVVIPVMLHPVSSMHIHLSYSYLSIRIPNLMTLIQNDIMPIPCQQGLLMLHCTDI